MANPTLSGMPRSAANAAIQALPPKMVAHRQGGRRAPLGIPAVGLAIGNLARNALAEDGARSFPKPHNGWIRTAFEPEMHDDLPGKAASAWPWREALREAVSICHIGAVDAADRPLQGAHVYRIRFQPVPPAAAFWSMTLYEHDTQLHPETPRGRHAIDKHSKALIYEDEEQRRLVVIISHQQPRGEMARANWMPAPQGPFYLILRQYNSKSSVLTRQWHPPAIEKLT